MGCGASRTFSASPGVVQPAGALAPTVGERTVAVAEKSTLDLDLPAGVASSRAANASPDKPATPPLGTKAASPPPGTRPSGLILGGGRSLEEHFTEGQLRLWNVTKLLRRLAAAAAAEEANAPLPTSPAAGSGARAASHLVRRSGGLAAVAAAGAGAGAGAGAAPVPSGAGVAMPAGEDDLAANSRKQVSECAVSLEFLLEFAREIPDEWKTGQVVQDLVKGFTVERQCRFTDMMPGRHVKRPDYFISHKWDSPFHYMVRSVRDYLSGAVPGEVYVWLDIFAVNQHPGKEQDDDLAQLSNAISNASGGTLVVLDHQAGPLGRVWCLFEIWITVREKGLGSLHLLTYGFTNNDIRECFQAIDVKTAKATNEDDRQRILKYIERSYETLDEFNDMLKLLFLLDPLDYSSDMKEMLRSITFSTAGTGAGLVGRSPALARILEDGAAGRGLPNSSYDLSGGSSRSADPLKSSATVQASMAAAAAQVAAARDAWRVSMVVEKVRSMDPTAFQKDSRGGAGRAVSGPSLMIVYGVVGGGKSTFVASLARIAQERRDRESRRLTGQPTDDPLSSLDLPEVQIDAHHFCKQSDRRRTDPLRMLKSLAYQLATNVPEMRPIYTSMPADSVSKISRLEEAFLELLQRPIQDYLEGSQLPSAPGSAARQDPPKGKDGRARSKQLVLLIDGVDEADGRAGSLDNNVLRLLREHFPKLHPAVHIIVSCRTSGAEDDPLAGLKGRYDKARTTIYDAASKLRQTEHVRRLLEVKLHPPGCRLDPSQCSMHDPEMLKAAVNMVTDKSYDSMVYIKVVLEHMTALIKEQLKRQREEKEVLENMRAVSDLSALMSAMGNSGQLPPRGSGANQLAFATAALAGDMSVRSGSSSLTQTPVDVEATASALGANIKSLIASRMSELAASGGAGGAGGEALLAKLDQEVQELVRGRFQGPPFALQDAVRTAAGANQPWAHAPARRSRSLAALSRRWPGAGRVPSGDVAAAMAEEEDNFRWNWQDIKNLPNGLDAAYRQIFIGCFQKLAPQSHAQVMKLLQVLLAAREPLTRNQLQKLQLVSSARDLQNLPGWGVLFFEREYMVFHMHKSLFEFLCNKKEAGPFYVDPQRGHKLIATQLFKEIMMAPTATAVGSSSASVLGGAVGPEGADSLTSSAVSQYTLRYAVTHLALADMLEELSQLLLNFDFWETIFEKGLGLEVLSDLIHIRGWELPKDTIAAVDVVAASSTVVSHVIRWLQRDGAMLKQYPKAVLQLATDTPVNSLVSKAALSYHRRPHAFLVNKDAGWPSNLMTLENSGHRVNSLAFLLKDSGSGSSLRLVTGADDGVVGVWDMRSGDLLFAMQPPMQAYQGSLPAVKCIAVATLSDGTTQIASAGKDLAVRLWNINTGQQFAELGKSNSMITDTVRALAMSPNGRIILSAGDDLALRAWTPGGVPKAAEDDAASGEADETPSPGVSQDGKLDPAKLWANPVATNLQDKPHRKVIRCIAFSADGHLFATGSNDDAATNVVALCLWETSGFRVRGILRGHIGAVKCVAFTVRQVSAGDGHVSARGGPPQHLLASGSADRTVRLWYTRAHAKVADDGGVDGSQDQWAVPNQALQGHTATVRAVAFSPDGIKLASAGEDRTVRLWGVLSRQQLAVFHGHSAKVVSLSFDSPDGMVLASCSDTEMRLWDTNNYPQVTVMHGHDSGVNTIAFTTNGRVIASGSDDGGLVVWKDCGENKWSKCRAIPRDENGKEGHSGSIIALAFSPADDDSGGMSRGSGMHLLATASADKTIRLWLVQEGQKLTEDQAKAIVTVTNILRRKNKLHESQDVEKDMEKAVHMRLLSVVQGHDGSVRAIAFSGDGSLLATGGNDRTVRLWSVPAKPLEEPITPFLVLSGHTDVIRCVSFSPVASSRLMASASEDRTVRLWHVVADGHGTSRLHCELKGHDSWVICCAFSSNGQRIATASLDKTVRIWSTINGEQQLVLHGHSSGVTSVAFSPDSMTLVSGGADSSVRQWNARTGQQLAMMQGHIGQIATVAYSPTGHAVASGAADATIRMWDATRGQQIMGVEDDLGSFQTVAVSPDDKLVASSADDNVIRVWDMNTGKQHAVLQGHTSWIVGVCFGYQDFEADGDPHLMLASCSDDCSIRVWDCETSECVRELRGHTGSVRAVAWESLKWNYIASAGNDYTVRLWNVARGSQVDLFKGHTDVIRALAFSPDGLILASSAEDTTVRLYHVGQITGSTADRPDWLPLLPGSGVVLRGHDSWVLSVAFAPRSKADNRLLVSGSWDNTVRLWSLPSHGSKKPTCTAVLRGHTGRINSVAVSVYAGQEIIASASNDFTVHLWSRSMSSAGDAVGSGKPAIGNGDKAAADPEAVAQGEGDTAEHGQSAVVGANGWISVAAIRGHAGHVNAVAFNTKGSRLASASEDQTVRLWDLAPTNTPDKLEAQQARDFKGIQGSITVLSMSPDGQLLASGNDDHTLRLWSTRSNQQLMVLQGHGSPVSALAFDDQGGVLASGSVCGTVLVWCKEEAGQGNRGGWKQVAKLEMALQVPDAAVSALALTHHIMAPTAVATTITGRPIPDNSEGLTPMTPFMAGAHGGGGGAFGGLLSPGAPSNAKLLLACGTKPREMQDRGLYAGGGYGAGMARPTGRNGGRRARGRSSTAATGNGDDDFFGGRMISSSLTVWDVEAIRLQSLQPAHLRSNKPFKALKCQSAISCAVFSDSGELLASSSFDHVVYLWRPEQQNPVARLCHPSAPDMATSLCFTQDGTMLVAACRYSERVDVYDIRRGIQACSAKEGSVTAPLQLGEVDGSGLEGIAVAPCDMTGDDVADRQVIVCRSGYKNQAMHLQVLELPSAEEAERARQAEEERLRRPSLPPDAAATAAAASAAVAASGSSSFGLTTAPSYKTELEPRELANVFTTMPIQQIACFGNLLVVTNGRSVNFYQLGATTMH